MPSEITCPECGGHDIYIGQIGDDEQGNSISGIFCTTPDCDHCYYEQSTTWECLHENWEKDEIGRYWCAECGDYLGERTPYWWYSGK